MQAPRDMLSNAIQQNTELRAHNAEPMEGNREYTRECIQPDATKMKIFDMTDPERHYGGAKTLDNFLAALRSNFQSHGQSFDN